MHYRNTQMLLMDLNKCSLVEVIYVPPRGCYKFYYTFSLFSVFVFANVFNGQLFHGTFQGKEFVDG